MILRLSISTLLWSTMGPRTYGLIKLTSFENGTAHIWTAPMWRWSYPLALERLWSEG